MCPQNPRSLENLDPIKPGEVRNPEGRNQYTYRRDAERRFDLLLKGELSELEIEDLKLSRHIRQQIETGELRSRLDVILAVSTEAAMAGNEKRLEDTIARLLPKTSKHEIEDTAGTLAALIRAARE